MVPTLVENLVYLLLSVAFLFTIKWLDTSIWQMRLFLALEYKLHEITLNLLVYILCVHILPDSML